MQCQASMQTKHSYLRHPEERLRVVGSLKCLRGKAMFRIVACLKYLKTAFIIITVTESTILVAAACTASGGVSACLSRLVFLRLA